jgi:hypothetical protein
MPKPGYTQSPEHKKKRLEQIEGDGNGSYKDGRRSYRRKAGAKDNDGTVVHHKNGDRTNNCASNLERLTDGDRTPGRRTTPAHEKHHGGRHGDSIAIRLAIRNDRKSGGCGRGKVGTGRGECKTAKGSKARQATGLSRLVAKPPSYTKKPAFSHRTAKESGAAKFENVVWPLAIGAGAIGVAGLAGTGIYLATRGKDDKTREAPTSTPLSVTTPPNERSKKIKMPLSAEKKQKKEVLKALVSSKSSAPKTSPPAKTIDKPMPSSPSLSKEEKKKRSQVIKGLLPAAGKTTDMPTSPLTIPSSRKLRPEDKTIVGKIGGRKSKETKAFESKAGQYHMRKLSEAESKSRFSKETEPKVSRTIDEIPGKLSSNDKEARRSRRKHIKRIIRGQSPTRRP